MRFYSGQNPDETHGVSSLIGDAVQGLLAVKGGVKQVFEKFVEASIASLFLNMAVSSIDKSCSQWSITYTSRDGSTDVAIFDKVIVVTPYFQSRIGGIALPVADDQYKKAIVTYFAANVQLSRTFFNVSQVHKDFGGILTTILEDSVGSTPEDTAFPFTSVSVVDYLPETGDFIYRIVSKGEIDPKVLEQVLEPNAVISWTFTKNWGVGYPVAGPIQEFVDFQDEENLVFKHHGAVFEQLGERSYGGC